MKEDVFPKEVIDSPRLPGVLVALVFPINLTIVELLSNLRGIDPNAALLQQNLEVAWVVSFILTFLAMIIFVAAVWNLLAVLWFVLVRNWTVIDAFNVIVCCRYPKNWFIDVYKG